MKGSLLAVAVLLSGCYGLPTTPMPPAACHFPDGTHFVFIGEASAAALGIPEGSEHIGRFWVSSERVSQLWRPKPSTAPVPVPSRQACGVFSDDTEIYGIPENWQPRLNVRY